ncbi:MAG: ABC transporter ATP-binding protein [Sulfolobales archaeon]
MLAVDARGLVKRYVTKRRRGVFRGEKIFVDALRGVSFSVAKGSIFGLLGPNGAGKTTTVKILATILLPDGGDAYVEGFSVTRESKRVREVLGVVLSADRGFYARLTGLENLIYYGMLYGLSRFDAKRRAEELLDLVDLGDSRHRLYEEYSLGMRARLALAKALIHDPSVVILDEPTIGLDPVSSRRIREILRRLAREGRSIMITTHNMWEAEILCNDIAVIMGGKIVASGSPEDLRRRYGGQRYIEIEILDPPDSLRIEGFEVMRNDGEIAVLRTRSSEDIASSIEKALSEARSLGLRIASIRVREPSLEDVFVEVVGNSTKI